MLLAGGWVCTLGVDPEKGKLYVSTYNGKTIDESNLDGSERRTLINCSNSPRGIAVDLNNRFVC